ncbi:MAG: glycogen/starch synthase [Chthoniobacterales bacterium]
MNILLAASELEPYASTGAFGESVSSLVTELRAQGHDVSVAIPFYRTARETKSRAPKRTGAKFSIPIGSNNLTCEIREARTSDGVQIFFVERDEFFDRSGIYGADGRDYQDNSARFAFFAKAVIELAKRMDPAPDVIQAHNWQAALVPVFAAHQRLGIPTVLVAENLEYQGNFWSYDFGLTNLPGEYFSARGLEYFGSLNYLKGGMLAANAVVVPGPRFVSEIQTPAGGSGLDPVTREQAGKIEGIAPGLDTSLWNPAADSSIAKKYKAPEGKIANRKAWLAKADLAIEANAPLVLVATEAMTLDGMPALLPAIDRIIESGARIVILGPVDDSNLADLQYAVRKHAGRLTWIPEADEKTLRLALAGSDILLSADPIAASADVLQKALRYGVIPVSLTCGGIASLTPAYRPGSQSSLGFTFNARNADAVADIMRFATTVFRDKDEWKTLTTRAMSLDFSWTATASRYASLYQSLAGGSARLAA